MRIGDDTQSYEKAVAAGPRPGVDGTEEFAPTPHPGSTATSPWMATRFLAASCGRPATPTRNARRVNDGGNMSRR